MVLLMQAVTRSLQLSALCRRLPVRFMGAWSTVCTPRDMKPAVILGLAGQHGNVSCVCPPAPSACGSHISKRHFWRMLNVVFNRPDRSRIKEVGPDLACAEWLLKCGAQVRWVGSDKFHTDYNTLPKENFKKLKLEEFNADEAAVMGIGFEHLSGISQLKKVRFHHCPYLEDDCIAQLTRVKGSLEYLEIKSCGDVSEVGLTSVMELQNLKTLRLQDLPAVRDKPAMLDKLQKALPNCHIEFADIEHEQKKA